MLPNAVAAVIECQTDSKLRLLQVVRDLCKYYGASITPTTYLFDRRGKLVFEPSAETAGDELLDQAIEAGALDVERDEDGNIVVLTEPNEITSVGETLTKSLGLKIESTELIWDPKKDSLVDVDSPQVLETLSKLTSEYFPPFATWIMCLMPSRSTRGRTERSRRLSQRGLEICQGIATRNLPSEAPLCSGSGWSPQGVVLGQHPMQHKLKPPRSARQAGCVN